MYIEPGMDRYRADVMVGGMVMLWTAMDLWGFDRMTISSPDIRYGAIPKKVREADE